MNKETIGVGTNFGCKTCSRKLFLNHREGLVSDPFSKSGADRTRPLFLLTARRG